VAVAALSRVSVKEVARMEPAHIDLIDVRTPGEYAGVHAVGARLMPLSGLDPAAVAAARTGAAGTPIYVLCKSGMRATKAAEQLIAAGIEAAVVEGGTDAWVAAGLPVVRGQGAISLERQVRIAAGLLVLGGAVLALTVNVWWLGLPAFVGAGLVFAGVTDTCGMGMMLGRMPWNKGGTCKK
jgi:rhodanese-related sulfurtransferase